MAMPQQRKIFRIEERLQADAPPVPPAGLGDDIAALRHHELITELAALRGLLEPQGSAAPTNLAIARELITGARELKAELDLIREAIRRTKEEVGGLQPETFLAPDTARLVRELAEVMTGTEQATQRILTAAEAIDQVANMLSSLLKDGYARGLAQDARDSVVKIFEACNFQDLTGQRITKVIGALKFIEDRIDHIREIWSRIDSAEAPTPAVAPPPGQGVDRKLLNGPKLPGDLGHSNQADVDLIFDSN
ncbi:MAG TPA: protein phosphatase CheZ [Xanthobacteraceae bacterium]|nr:protein phosphatase CheZ [Xanthobacteraceae bacterium]